MRITLKYVCLAAAILQVSYSLPRFNFDDDSLEDPFEAYMEIYDDSKSDSSDDQSELDTFSDYPFNVFSVSLSEDDIDELVKAFFEAFTIDFGLLDFLDSSSEEIDSTETQLERPPILPATATDEESNSTFNFTLQSAKPNSLENQITSSDQGLPVVGSLPIPQFVPNKESNSTVNSASQSAKPNFLENQIPTLNQGNDLEKPSPTPATILESIPLSASINPSSIGTDTNNTLILSLPGDQVNDVDGEGVSDSTEKSNN